MLRFAILFLLSTIAVFASTSGLNSFGTFGDALPIYVIGDASGVIDGFKFVAMIVGHSFTQAFILMGAVWALHKVAFAFAKGDGRGGLLEFGYIFFVIMFFLYPATTITVQDGRVANGSVLPDVVATGTFGYESYSRVDDIPLGIALIASATTTVSWELANLLEVAIAPISDAPNLGITSAGINQPAKDMRWIVKNLTKPNPTNGTTEDYERRLAAYVVTCAMPTVDIDVRNATKIMNPPDADYVTYLSPTELPVARTLITDPVSKSQNIDCEVYWNTYLSGANSTDFDTNILDTYRAFKKSSGVSPSDEVTYETQIRKLVNGEATAAIAGLKDSLGALKRASVVASAVDASGTGIPGIDMSNRLQMTEAKQSMMIQGPASFAWLGEMLPLAINIGIAFLVVMSILMAIFLLFQGWIKGLGVILNFASGFMALAFSYVSLAITQGIVNRKAYENVLEQYTTQGSPLQVSNYNYLLEQSATMDGLTGLLGGLFVAAGTAIVFYGESKMITSGIMGKVQGSFGGNNLDKTSDDNAQDNALADSMARTHTEKMAKKLTAAGIPFDGGNIEYEYAKMQKHIGDLGSAQGARLAMQGDTSAESKAARDNLAVASTVQSFEKSKNQQGFGEKAIEISGGDLDSIEDLKNITDGVKAGARAKGMGSASAMYAESKDLEGDAETNKYVEGMTRDARVKVAKTKGVGAASVNMPEYLDDMEKESTAGFLSAGVKASATADRALRGDDKTKLDKDYAEGIYRGEASNIESTKAKARALGGDNQRVGREEFISNAGASAIKKETMGQSEGHKAREDFGDMGTSTKVPLPNTSEDSIYAVAPKEDKSESKKVDTKSPKAKKEEEASPSTEAEVSTKSGKVNTPDSSNIAKPSESSTPTSTSSEKKEPSKVPDTEWNKKPVVPYTNEASQTEKATAKTTGLSLKELREGKQSIIGHESSGSLKERLETENKRGYVGMAQFGAAALADVGEVDKKKFHAAKKKAKSEGRKFDREAFLANDDNWTKPGGKASFKSSFKRQDAALDKLMGQNFSTMKKHGVSMNAPEHKKGLLMAAHLGGAGNAIGFAKHGKGFRDGNGTSIGSYYNAGAKGITKGFGVKEGQDFTPGGGVRNTNTASMGMGSIAAAYARKGGDEWSSTGNRIAENYATDPSMYGKLAYNSEAMRTTGASNTMEAQGGLEKALSMNLAQATVQGAQMKAGFEGTTTQTAIAAGHSSEDAKKLAEGIANGSIKGSELFQSGIVGAAMAAAKVLGAEKEGQSQSHAEKLRSEFGGTLTEKESSISGKTYKEEADTKSSEKDSAKKEEWDQRAEKLKDEKSFVDSMSDKKSAAALAVKDSIGNTINNETSYSDTGRKKARQEMDAIVSDVEKGKEVSEDRIEKAFGKKVGSNIISDMKQNGVVFEDAKGIGTGDAIDVSATGKRVQDSSANNIVIGALNEQAQTNLAELKSGNISQEEFNKRQKSIDYLAQGARGQNGGSMPMADFENAGFTDEKLAEKGIEKAPTSYKTDDGRMRSRQVSNINSESVLKAESKALGEEVNKEMPKTETPKEDSNTSSVSTPKEKKTDEPTSWNDLASAHAGKKVDEFIGGGKGIISNTAQNSEMYKENALYGEKSKALSTQAKIDAQGGVDKAVGLDVADSTVKASMQKGGTEEQVKQLLMDPKAGKSESEAEKISKALGEGGATAANLISAGIVRSASALASAQSGAKMAGDLSTIKATGGKDSYIQASSVEGAKRGATSKVQNIDMGNKENSQGVAEGILRTTRASDRGAVLESMKDFGMVTKDSTLDNVQATTGKQFLAGKAAAAAATMSKDDRLSFAGYSYHVATDSTSGRTKVEASDTEGLSTGTYVHDRTGIKIDNPVQMAASAVTGEKPTDLYLGNTNGQKEGNYGDDSLSGGAVIGGTATALAVGGVALKNKRVGNAVSAGADKVKHRIKGNTEGRDSQGKKGVFYSDDNWEKLKANGMASKGDDGWKLDTDRMKAKEFIGSQPSSAGAFTSTQTAKSPNPIKTPIANDVNNIGNSLLNDISNDTTKETLTGKKAEISAKKDNVAGKEVLNSALDEVKTQENATPKQKARAVQMQTALEQGMAPKADEIKELTGKEFPKNRDDSVNVSKTGVDAKAEALNTLDKKINDVEFPDDTTKSTSTFDSNTAKVETETSEGLSRKEKSLFQKAREKKEVSPEQKAEYDRLNKKYEQGFSQDGTNDNVDSSKADKDTPKSETTKSDSKATQDVDVSGKNNNVDTSTKMKKSNMRPGFINSKAAKIAGGGIVGLALAEGITRAATGEGAIAPLVENIGSKVEEGKYFGEGGASSVVGGLFIGEENYNDALKEGKKGNYGTMLKAVAGGFVDNVVNGVGFLGSAAVSAVETVVGDESFRENLQENMLPQSDLAGKALDRTAPTEKGQQLLQAVVNAEPKAVGGNAVADIATQGQNSEQKVAGEQVAKKIAKDEPVSKEELVQAGANQNIVDGLPVNKDGSVDTSAVGQGIQTEANNILASVTKSGNSTIVPSNTGTPTIEEPQLADINTVSPSSSSKEAPTPTSIAKQEIERKKADHSHEANKEETNKPIDHNHDAELPKENKAEDKSHEENKIEDIETKMDVDAITKQSKAPSQSKPELKTNTIGENKEADNSHNANKTESNKEADNSHNANKEEENKAEDKSHEANKIENIESKMDRDADEKQGKPPVSSTSAGTGIENTPIRELKEADNSHNANKVGENKEADHSHDANKIEANKASNQNSDGNKPKTNKADDRSHEANKTENIEREMDVEAAEIQANAPKMPNTLMNTSAPSVARSFDSDVNKVSKQDDVSAGESFLQSSTPDSNKENVLAEAKAGTLTPKKMLENGIHSDTVKQTPLKQDGTVDVNAVGQNYKTQVPESAPKVEVDTPNLKSATAIGATKDTGETSTVATGKVDAPKTETSKVKKIEEVETTRIEKVKTETINIDSPKTETVSSTTPKTTSIDAPKADVKANESAQTVEAKPTVETKGTESTKTTIEAPKVDAEVKENTQTVDTKSTVESKSSVETKESEKATATIDTPSVDLETTDSTQGVEAKSTIKTKPTIETKDAETSKATIDTPKVDTEVKGTTHAVEAKSAIDTKATKAFIAEEVKVDNVTPKVEAVATAESRTVSASKVDAVASSATTVETPKIETVASGVPSVEAPKVAVSTPSVETSAPNKSVVEEPRVTTVESPRSASVEVPNVKTHGSEVVEERRTTSEAPSTTEAPKVIKTTEVQTVTAPDTSSTAPVAPLVTSAIRVPEATGTTTNAPIGGVANQMHSEAPVQAMGGVAQPTPQTTAVPTPMATLATTTVAPQSMPTEQPQFVHDPNGATEELGEMSKNATSLGNMQTNRSDLKKSTDDGSAAIVNALQGAQNGGASQEDVSFNAAAIQSLVSGMAFSSPMQTQGGELNLSRSADGLLALGAGGNKVETAIPYEAFKNSSDEVKEGFASTLARTKLNNDDIEKYSQQEDVGALKTMDQTEIVWNARQEAKQMGENARILAEDGNDSLEYLTESFEKIEMALNPKEDKQVV